MGSRQPAAEKAAMAYSERRVRAAKLLEESAVHMQQTRKRWKQNAIQGDPLELVSRVGCHKSFMVTKEQLENMPRLAALPADSRQPARRSRDTSEPSVYGSASLVPVMRPNADYTSAKITALLCREAVKDGDSARRNLLAMVDEILLTEQTFALMLHDADAATVRAIPQRVLDEFGSRVTEALDALRLRLEQDKKQTQAPDPHLSKAVALWKGAWTRGVLPTRVGVCDMLFGLGRRIMLDAAELRIILDTLAHWALVDDKPERAVRTLMSGQPQDDNGRVSLLNTAIVLGASVVLVEPGAVVDIAGGRHLPRHIKIKCRAGMVVCRSLWLTRHRRQADMSADDDAALAETDVTAGTRGGGAARTKHRRLPDNHPYVPMLCLWTKTVLQPPDDDEPAEKMAPATLDVLQRCMWALKQREGSTEPERRLSAAEAGALRLLAAACQSPRAMSLCDWHRLVDSLSQRWAISKVAVLRDLVKEEILYRAELDQLIMTVRNLAPGRSMVPMVAVVKAVREFVVRAAAAAVAEQDKALASAMSPSRKQ